jgi:hypothetical protein
MKHDKPSPEKYLLSEYESQRIFEEEIIPSEFGSLVSVDRPSVHFFGAQPGAGKSSVQAYIQEVLVELDGSLSVASVIGDDFRPYHPEYSALVEENESLAAFYTDRDSGRWVERAINHTLQIKPNVILEGTLRNPQVTLDTATQYQAKGFDREMHIVAVHEFVSRLRIFERYLQQVEDTGSGRYTLPEAHDRSYSALPQSLHTLAESGMFNRITLYNAFGDVLFCAVDTTAAASSDLETILMNERKNGNLDFDSLINTAEQLAKRAKLSYRSAVLGDLTKLTEEIRRAANT